MEATFFKTNDARFTRSRTFRVFRSCNELTGLLQDWTTNRQSARTIDDVFNKLPFTDEKREFTYFRMEDFYNFCKRNHWEMDKTKTGNLLKQLR